MTEADTPEMALRANCPHCGADCEFDLPEKADTDLAAQIKISCHSCAQKFPLIRNEPAPPPKNAPVAELTPEGDPADNKPEPHKYSGRKHSGRRYSGFLLSSLVILLLVGGLSGAGFWLITSDNPTIKRFVDARIVQLEAAGFQIPWLEAAPLEPARFEVTHTSFERKQSDTKFSNNKAILNITVKIANRGGQPDIPRGVELQLLSPHGQVIFGWIMDTGKLAIKPGQTKQYLARLVAPPTAIGNIRVLLPPLKTAP